MAARRNDPLFQDLGNSFAGDYKMYPQEPRAQKFMYPKLWFCCNCDGHKLIATIIKVVSIKFQVSWYASHQIYEILIDKGYLQIT